MAPSTRPRRRRRLRAFGASARGVRRRPHLPAGHGPGPPDSHPSDRDGRASHGDRICGGTPWHDADVLAALGSRPDALIARWRQTATVIDPVVVWQAIVDQGIGVAAVGSAGYPPVLAADIEPPGGRVPPGRRQTSSPAPGWRSWAPADAVPPAQQSPGSWAATWRPPAWRSFPGSPSGIDGAGHRGALSAARDVGGAARSASSAAASTSSIRAPKRSCGGRWRRTVSCCPRRRWAPGPSAGASRPATASSPRSPTWSSSSSRTARGGSMHTVDEADRRGIDVMAVPGSVRAPGVGGHQRAARRGPCPGVFGRRRPRRPGAAARGPPLPRRRSAAPARPGRRPGARGRGMAAGHPRPDRACARATAWRSWRRRSTGCARRDGSPGAAAGTSGSPGGPP